VGRTWMSVRELKRVEVLGRVKAGDVTLRQASELLAISYRHIKRLKQNGVGLIYITHKLDELTQIADDITVLRDGKLVWRKDTSDTDKQDLIRGMVGRSVDFERDPTCIPQNDESLVVDNISDGPTKEYYFHYRKVNEELELLSGRISADLNEIKD